MTPLMCHFLPSCEVSEGVLSVSVSVSSFYLSASVSLTFIFTKKSDCDKLNLVFYVISLITVLVKLLIKGRERLGTGAGKS